MELLLKATPSYSKQGSGKICSMSQGTNNDGELKSKIFERVKENPGNEEENLGLPENATGPYLVPFGSRSNNISIRNNTNTNSSFCSNGEKRGEEPTCGQNPKMHNKKRSNFTVRNYQSGIESSCQDTRNYGMNIKDYSSTPYIQNTQEHQANVNFISQSVDFFEDDSVAFPLKAPATNPENKNGNPGSNINVLLPVILISVTYIIFGCASAKLFVMAEAKDEMPGEEKERKLLLTLMSVFLIANGSINFLFYLLGETFRSQFKKRFVRCPSFFGCRLCFR